MDAPACAVWRNPSTAWHRPAAGGNVPSFRGCLSGDSSNVRPTLACLRLHATSMESTNASSSVAMSTISSR
eukprot:248315-Pleurochrysis_carterae.AAC.1